VAVQDIHTGAVALAANSKTRLGLWNYIKTNFDEVKGYMSMVVFDRFLKMSLQKFTDFETEKEIAAFFEGKNNRGYDRTLGVVSDTIKGRAGYRTRDREVLLGWLKANNYV
jgi:aminopeptidase N